MSRRTALAVTMTTAPSTEHPAVAPVPPAPPAPPVHQPQRPDPGIQVQALTRALVEILAGARHLEQVSRWVNDDVYRHLATRVVLAARHRSVTGRRVARPALRLGPPVLSVPREGIVDAVVVAHLPDRSRAVALRLEGHGDRWRASAVHVL